MCSGNANFFHDLRNRIYYGVNLFFCMTHEALNFESSRY